MPILISTTLEAYTCGAEGHSYAVQTVVSDISKHICPICAKRQIKNLQDALNDVSVKNTGLTRTIVALKGTITRLKRK